MVRRYRRRNRRRRTFRRRRFTRSRRVPRNLLRYDGQIAQKIHTSMELAYSSADSGAQMLISWANSGSSDIEEQYIDDALEFQALSQVYREYKVMYLTIKVFAPAIMQQLLTDSSDTKSINSIMSGSSTVLTTNFTTGILQKTFDFKETNARFPHVRHFKVDQYAKSKGFPRWLATDTAQNLDMNTGIRINAQGYLNDTYLGKVDIIWYVKFRGYIANQP